MSDIKTQKTLFPKKIKIPCRDFFIFIAVFALIVTFLIYIEETIFLATHWTLDPPPKYQILTNGERYRYKNTNNGFVSYSICSTRLLAVSKAWSSYEEDQEKKKLEPKMWEVID